MPWRTFWNRRALGTQDRWIRPLLIEYAEGLIEDKGGLDSITAGEQRLVEIAQCARGATMLILAEASKQGFIRSVETKDSNGPGSWDLAPGAKDLSKFLTIERNALQTLGITRRVKEPKSIEQWLHEDGDKEDVDKETKE